MIPLITLKLKAENHQVRDVFSKYGAVYIVTLRQVSVFEREWLMVIEKSTSATNNSKLAKSSRYGEE